MRVLVGSEFPAGPSVSEAGLNRLRLANEMALLGRVSWELFQFTADAEDVEDMAFVLAYEMPQNSEPLPLWPPELPQSFLDVMAWPSRVRRDNWRRLVERRKHEKEQTQSKE